MPNQVNYTAAEIVRIQNAENLSLNEGQYAEVYRTVIAIDNEHRAAGTATLDARTRYWFDHADDINANDPTNASNIFIRGVTANGLSWDGRSGSVYLDSLNVFYKWVLTFFMLRPGWVAAG